MPTIASPGNRVVHHAPADTNSRLIAKSVPHSGVGSCIPRPRNPKDAMVRIEFPRVSTARVAIVDAICGNTLRNTT